MRAGAAAPNGAPVALPAAGSAGTTVSGTPSQDWALHIAEHAFKKHSQGTQDGALEYIFKNIGTLHTPPFFVEFGFDKNTYEASMANTWYMFEKGWRGVMLDGSHENPAINLHKRWVAAETIVQTLTGACVGGGCVCVFHRCPALPAPLHCSRRPCY